MIRVLALAAAGLLVSGCDEVADLYNRVVWPNTTLAVAICVARNAEVARVLSLDGRVYCARQHSRAVMLPAISSTGGRQCTSGSSETRSFAATVYNDASNQVVTALVVSVRDGTRTIFSDQVDVWLQPLARERVLFSLPDPVTCQGEPLSWDISSARGVTLKLR